MKARLAAVKSLLKYLHKSEADRFAPKQEEAPAPAEKSEGEMSPEMLSALESLTKEG